MEPLRYHARNTMGGTIKLALLGAAVLAAAYFIWRADNTLIAAVVAGVGVLILAGATRVFIGDFGTLEITEEQIGCSGRIIPARELTGVALKRADIKKGWYVLELQTRDGNHTVNLLDYAVPDDSVTKLHKIIEELWKAKGFKGFG